MGIAFLAALCMVIQDSLAVIKYQAAARNRGPIVAAADCVIWFVASICITITSFTLHGHNFEQKVLVVVFVTAANITGNLLGTWMGKKFVSDKDETEQDRRLASVESRLNKLEEHASSSSR